MKRSIPLLGAFAALILLMAGLGGFAPSAQTPGKQAAKPVIRLNNYADLFLRGTYDMLHTIRVREIAKIGQACKIANRRKLAGGRIISHIDTPHIMYAGACAEDVPGNPNIAPDYKRGDKRATLPADLGAGDFLIVAIPGNQEIRKRGCFLLGLGFPMPTNRYSPPKFNDTPDTPMETQVDLMLYDWAPKEDGLVTPSLNPTYHLKILPTSPVTVVFYWTIMAQLAQNIASQDTSGSFTAAAAYLDTLMGRIDVFHERYIADINIAGERMAEKILAGGKMIPWSTREEFFVEASGTAGGLMGIYPLRPDSLTKNDVVILAAAAPTPEREIEMAQRIRAKGAFLVGIFPFTREDGVLTAQLRKLCDMSFDNLSGDSDGVFRVQGYPKKVIPTNGLMNNFAYWALTGAYVQAMERRGVSPYYWMSFHVEGGTEYDNSVQPLYRKRGY